jgi:hypothetical protein
VSSKDQLGRVLLAYALKGRVSCAATNHGTTLEQVLPELAKLVSTSKVPTEPGFHSANELPGFVSLIRPSGTQPGAVGISTQGLVATLDAQVAGASSDLVLKPGLSPFAQASPSGMAVVRLRLKMTDGAQSLGAFFKRVPGAAALMPPVEAVAPFMTGNVLVFIHRVEVVGSLHTDEARFRALKMAVLLETSDAAAAKKALDALPSNTGKTPLQFTMKGAIVSLSNDEAALKVAVLSLPSAPTKQLHALELVVDPAAMAHGLAQVPLLDAIQNPALAGLLAVGTELGPLLVASEPVTGWADPASAVGLHRAQLTWPLQGARFH